jgi:hypothetical protein
LHPNALCKTAIDRAREALTSPLKSGFIRIRAVVHRVIPDNNRVMLDDEESTSDEDDEEGGDEDEWEDEEEKKLREPYSA